MADARSVTSKCGFTRRAQSSSSGSRDEAEKAQQLLYPEVTSRFSQGPQNPPEVVSSPPMSRPAHLLPPPSDSQHPLVSRRRRVTQLLASPPASRQGERGAELRGLKS